MKTSEAPNRDPNTGRFVTGNSGGPGRRKGSRNKISEAFLQALEEDWSQNGPEAIRRMREESPVHFVKLVAGLITKQPDVAVNDLEDMTDEEIKDELRALNARLGNLLDDEAAEDGGHVIPSATEH